MDPVTVLVSAGAVSKLALGCTGSLYSFISSSKIVDVSVKALYKEVKELEQTANIVESTLRQPNLHAFHDIELWATAEDSLCACSDSLQRLNKSLQGLRSHNDKKWYNRGITQFKLNLKEDQIRDFRTSIHSHRLALATIVQMIEVHISSLGPSMVLNEVVPRIDSLMRTVQILQQDIQKSATPEVAHHGENSAILLRTSSRLSRSARRILTEVGSAVGGDTRFTIFGGTEPDLDFQSSVGTYRVQNAFRPTVSLEPPSTFSPQVAAWITSTSEVTNLSSEDSNSQTTSSDKLHNIPLGVVDPTSAVNEVSLPIWEENDGYDSDPGIDLDILERYVTLGRAAATKGDFNRNELFLRRALAEPQLLTQLSTPISQNDLRNELAAALVEQQKTADARTLCEQLLQFQIHDDSDRVRTLSVSHILARINLLEGRLSEAESQCRQALKGRKLFQGETTEYFATVALMSTIRKAQGDIIDSEAYEAILPAGYVRPSYDMPKNPGESDPFGQEPITQSSAMNTNELTQSSTTSDASLLTAVRRASSTLNSISESMNIRKSSIGSHDVHEELSNGSGITFLTSVISPSSPLYKKLLDSMTSLHWKVADGRVDDVIHQLKNTGNKVDLTKSPLKVTPLHIAAIAGHGNVAKVLLDHCASRASQDSSKRTPLHWAALAGHAPVASLLLEHGMSATSRDEDKKTPIHHAAVSGSVEIAELLFQKHVMVDSQDSQKWTPLHTAAFSNNGDFAQLLVARGANIMARESRGRTPLHWAAYVGAVVAGRVLIEAGSDLNAQDGSKKTALHDAVFKGNAEFIILLLDKGANTTIKNKSGDTALDMAISSAREDLIILLRDR